jgi:tRNA acetyltransferase TAN1
VDRSGIAAKDADSDDEEVDVESQIQKEILAIRTPIVDPLFKAAKVDTECCKFKRYGSGQRVLTQTVVFFKTRAPVEPVSFVRKICQDTADGVEQQRRRTSTDPIKR